MIGYFDTELGRVQISPTIARRIILSEIEKSRFFQLPGTESGEPITRKIAERCIRVNFEDGVLDAVLVLNVLYGSRIIKEARDLQGKIARTLQLRAGLEVSKIEINVENVFQPNDDKEPLFLEQNKMEPNAVNQ